MRRDLLVFAALAVVAPVASAAASDFSKPRFVQTESAPERSIALLGKLDKAIAENKTEDITIHLEELLRQSRGDARNLVVPMKASEDELPRHFRGFRDLVLSRLCAAPKAVRDQIKRAHDAAVRGLIKRAARTGVTEALMIEIVEDYPLAEQAREAALSLAQLAFERDDIVACERYDAFLRRFYHFGVDDLGTLARRCLVAARLGERKRAESQLRILKARVKSEGRADLTAYAEGVAEALTVILGEPKPAPTLEGRPRRLKGRNTSSKDRLVAFWKEAKEPSPNDIRRAGKRIILRLGRGRAQLEALRPFEPPRFLPRVLGHEVFVSNGRRVFVYDTRTGRRVARLPFHVGETVTDPPPLGMETELVFHGGLLASTLVVPRTSPTLKRERVLAGQGFGQNFCSLFLFDARRGHKIVYWEGDRGPSRTPDAGEKTRERRGRRSLAELALIAHPLGRPALCGRRIYVSALVAAAEPEVWVLAYDRGDRIGGDLGVGLTPIWATYVGTAPRIDGNADEELIPTVFPEITHNGHQVFCHTGTATIAALDAVDGTLNWVVHSTEPAKATANPNRPFFRGNQVPAPAAPPPVEALGFVSRPGLPNLVVVAPPATTEVSAFDAATGRLAWSTSRQRSGAHRFFILDDRIVLRYGKRDLIAIDGRNGKLCSMPVKGSFNKHQHLPARDAVEHHGDLRGRRLLLPLSKGRVQLVELELKSVGDGDSVVVSFDLGRPVKLVGTKETGNVVFTDDGVALATERELLIFGPYAEGPDAEGDDAPETKPEAKPKPKTKPAPKPKTGATPGTPAPRVKKVG